MLLLISAAKAAKDSAMQKRDVLQFTPLFERKKNLTSPSPPPPPPQRLDSTMSARMDLVACCDFFAMMFLIAKEREREKGRMREELRYTESLPREDSPLVFTLTTTTAKITLLWDVRLGRRRWLRIEESKLERELRRYQQRQKIT